MDKISISVIMSVYNGEKYLSESIESILNQTYNDFEFLIINDGSMDKTNEILNNYLIKETSRIKIINFDNNRGLSYHLSKITDYTDSELLIRMDADDISYPTRIENIISAYDNYNFDWYNSFVEHIDSESNSLGIVPDSNINIEYKIKYLNYMNFFCHGSAAFSIKALQDVSGYDASLEYSQDFDLWLKFLTNKKKLHFDERILYQQRITNESISIKNLTEQTYFALKIVTNYPGHNKIFNGLVCFCYNYYNGLTETIYSYFVIISKKILLFRNS